MGIRPNKSRPGKNGDTKFKMLILANPMASTNASNTRYRINLRNYCIIDFGLLDYVKIRFLLFLNTKVDPDPPTSIDNPILAAFFFYFWLIIYLRISETFSKFKLSYSTTTTS
jgi:hypothetical protein